MPVYAYRCTNCGFLFEQQQKFSDAALTRCPECSKKTLQKVFQPVGIVFKGSGFYATDHRSPSGQSRSSSNTKSSESSSEKVSTDDSDKPSESSKPSSSDE
jgi:putative FmdB family regulatory protein